MGMTMWTFPDDRYFPVEGLEPHPPTDGEIKSTVVHRLRENPFTMDEHLRVDVKHSVVLLRGGVSSTAAKLAATEDAWCTPGVADVSNQLVVAEAS
jgi:osmotically-inducible protein OsmY